METLRRLRVIFQPFYGVLGGMLGFLLIQELIVLVNPTIYGKFIDALVSRQGFYVLFVLAVIWFCVGTVENIVGYYKYLYELRHFDFALPRDLAGKTLKKFLTFSVGQHTNQHSGVRQSVINEGEGALIQLATMGIYNVVPPFLKAVIVTAYLSMVNRTLGTICAAGMLLFFGISLWVNRIMSSELKDFQEMRHENHKLHSEIIRNPDLIEINARELYAIERYDGQLEAFGEKGVALWSRYVKWLFLVRAFVPDITNYATILTGAYLVIHRALSPGHLVTIMALSSMSMNGLSSLSNMQRQLTDNWEKMKKYFVMMDVEPDVTVFSNPVVPSRYEGAIELRNVRFAYPFRSYVEDDETKTEVGKSDEPVLDGVSVSIRKGERVALVGKNGAGKSTFFHLLVRAFDPDKGQVLIDGNDLRLLDLDHYRKHGVGFVEQDIRLFDATLRENLLFVLNGQRQSLAEDDLARVLRISRMESFLPRMEYGLDTLIGEKGVKLSGGQKKMVGIARAIIKNPSILLFDEATAGLDQEEESLLYESLAQAAAGRTTIVSSA